MKGVTPKHVMVCSIIAILSFLFFSNKCLICSLNLKEEYRHYTAIKHTKNESVDGWRSPTPQYFARLRKDDIVKEDFLKMFNQDNEDRVKSMKSNEDSRSVIRYHN